MLLYEKYTPFTLNGIVGNRLVIKRLEEFSAQVQQGKKIKPLMLFGPSGTGKTTAAHAFAYANGFELIEFNSSDYRDSETLEKRLLPAMNSRNLFNKKIVVLFDEIDELSAKFDSGAEAIVSKVLKNSKHPIILTANDFWNRKISFMRDSVEKLEFKRLRKEEIHDLIKDIAAKENQNVSSEILEAISSRSSGDIRGAINDLQLAFGAGPEIIEQMGVRDRKLEIFAILDKIFNSGNFDVSRNAVTSSDVELDMLINWVDQNIPTKYLSKRSISEAYRRLSKASMFNENASRSNYYGYWRYVSVLSSSGVAIASDGYVGLATPYTFPSNIKFLSSTKKDRDVMSSIALKLSPVLHSSKKDIINNAIPMLKLMIEKGIKEEGEERTLAFMNKEFKIEEDEVAAILNFYRFK